MVDSVVDLPIVEVAISAESREESGANPDNVGYRDGWDDTAKANN